MLEWEIGQHLYAIGLEIQSQRFGSDDQGEGELPQVSVTCVC